MNLSQEIQVKNLDHLGIVAGIIDDMGLVEHINQLVGQQPGEIVSPGHVVKAVFAQILGDFRKQLTLDTLMVADSALYSTSNLEQMKELKWLCRVPLTVKQAKELVSQLTEKDFVKSGLKGYNIAERTSNYGGIEQRWLVVESKARRESDLHRLERNLEKASKTAEKKLQKLSKQKFDNQNSAVEAAEQLNRELKYHNLKEIDVVDLPSEPPKKAAVEAGKITYKVQASLVSDRSVIDPATRCAGRFVLATNVLDTEELSNDQMLAEYKAQQSAKRGFSFLKDPLFFTDSIFLKSPERVEALAMLMGLCLLIYTLAQRQLRQALKQSQSRLKNQLDKLTERPTLRWIFQCFQSVHLLMVNGSRQISNLTSERLEILRFFPDACRRYYLLL